MGRKKEIDIHRQEGMRGRMEEKGEKEKKKGERNAVSFHESQFRMAPLVAGKETTEILNGKIMKRRHLVEDKKMIMYLYLCLSLSLSLSQLRCLTMQDGGRRVTTSSLCLLGSSSSPDSSSSLSGTTHTTHTHTYK